MTNPNDSHMDQTIREYYAGCFMESLIKREGLNFSSKSMATISVNYADNLIAALNKSKEEKESNHTCRCVSIEKIESKTGELDCERDLFDIKNKIIDEAVQIIVDRFQRTHVPGPGFYVHEIDYYEIINDLNRLKLKNKE